MKVAVLPFNAAEGTRPAYGRQFVNFATDAVRSATGAEVNAVSFLAQIEGEGGRSAFVNIADTLFDREWIDQFFEQSGADIVFDGLVKQNEDGSFDLTVRRHEKGQQEPAEVKERHFSTDEVFGELHSLIKDLAKAAEANLPEQLSGESMEFGTDNGQAFLKFLEGHDALNYVNQANGIVAAEFSPKPAMDSLLESYDMDPDFVGPYEVLVQLCRACAHYRIGNFEDIEHALLKLQEQEPEDFKAFFALGEAYQAINNMPRAADLYEKSVALEPEMAALYTRLGLAQIAQNMPVNAERNFRKAIELDPDDLSPLDFLVMVLQQTGRAHEVPSIWKGVIDKNPQNAQAQAKYALALYQAGNEEEGTKAFEDAINVVEENDVIKRYYAPILAMKGDLDRAMDFYEDCLDSAPNDIPLLLEYAQTLQRADRTFEIPRVLRDVLSSNPDPNTRAETMAWLIELEQPKRTAVVEAAREKIESGDAEGTVRDLKPLRNWLADYWKMWALLSSAHNHLGEHVEAEEAAKRLLEIYPGCEPAYGELVNALSQQGKHAEAYNSMRFAAMNMPQSLGVHVNLALAAKRAGHQDEAKALAKQIREVVGPNEDLEQILQEIDR